MITLLPVKIMILRRLILLLLMLNSHHAFARMYQWVEPDTGTTQLSGKPPAWYRSADGGPRVLVFDKGRLVDDTAIELAEDVRRNLRKQAFILAEQDRQLAKEKLVKAKQLKRQFATDEIDEQVSQLVVEEEQTATADAVIDELQRQGTGLSEEALSEEKQMADRLREMISEWEETRIEKAKQTLD